MIQTNKDNLVVTEILGEITHPALRTDLSYTTTWDGKSKLGIGMGSIKYNVKIGDPCFGWAEGENVEPGVALDILVKELDQSAVRAFRILACIGNEAVVVDSKQGKGAQGVVIGKHGYIPRVDRLVGGHHVLVSFKDEDLEKLAIGDKIAVKSRGIGLKIEGFENVRVFSIDPELLERMGIEIENGKLVVPVVTEIPAYLLGQGSGGMLAETSSFEIQTSFPIESQELELKRLRLGDVVACRDILTSWGRGFYKGATTIGVVCTGSSDLAGHGIGITCILTSREDKIKPKLNSKANIGYYLGLLE